MKRLFFLIKTPVATWFAAAGAALGMIFGAFSLPGGEDLYRYYIPFVQGCLNCGFVPHYAQWIFFPFQYLPPYPHSWGVWVMVTLVLFAFFADQFRINPFLFFISFPFLGQIWLGQVDVVIAGGLAVLLLSRNPYWQGVGLILMLTKPQLSLLAILVWFVSQKRFEWYKILLFPFLLIIASLIVYGPTWYLTWLQNAVGLPVHAWRLAGRDTWLYGLMLLPLPFFFHEQYTRVKVALLVSALATPFFGVYSYVLFLLMGTTIEDVALSYIWLLAYPWLGEDAMRFAWVLPLFILAKMTWVEMRLHRNMGNLRMSK